MKSGLSHCDTYMYWGPRMRSSSNRQQPSRWIAAVDTVQTRAYSWRRRAATGAVATLAIFMGYHVVFGHNGLTAYEHKREDTRALVLQMQDLERENDRLRGHVDRLQNDPGAIEHQAREELHYTRAGEVIYTLPPDPKPPAGQTASKP
jgi:cell division protein FtsB